MISIPGPRATRLLLAGLLTALPLTAAACGDDDDDDAGPATTAAPDQEPEAEPVADEEPVGSTLEVVTDEYGFELTSDRVAAGLVTVTLDNGGDEAHHVTLAKLHDGVSLDDFLRTLPEDEAAAFAMADMAGGVNPVDPGETGSVQVELEPGTYTLVCFIPAPDGASHAEHGMVRQVEVVETDEPAADAPTDVVGEVVMADFSITPPAGGLVEPGTYRFVNEGTEGHEAVFLRLNDGKTMADLATYSAGGSVGEAPFTFEGGMATMAPGGEAYAELDIRPGSWVALCVVPGQESGIPHIDMGMLLPFEVPTP